MRSAVFAGLSLLFVPLAPHCDRAGDHATDDGTAKERPDITGETSAPRAIVTRAASAPSSPSAEEMPHVAEAKVPGDLPAFVVRGVKRHALSVVFFAGLCAHPGGYLAAFPWTAVEHGDVLGLQGDIPCGDGTYRKWGNDLARIDRRIDAAFRAAGLEVPSEIVLIGYSQGAERAERLAALFPERYKKVVLISSPVTASPTRLAHASAVLLGIGAYESRASTMAGVEALESAGITTGWFVLPRAHHGDMGPDAQTVMGDALAWLEDARDAGENGNATIRTPVGHTAGHTFAGHATNDR